MGGGKARGSRLGTVGIRNPVQRVPLRLFLWNVIARDFEQGFIERLVGYFHQLDLIDDYVSCLSLFSSLFHHKTARRSAEILPNQVVVETSADQEDPFASGRTIFASEISQAIESGQVEIPAVDFNLAGF